MQANFYPLPTMAFIEDSNMRLSLLTGQSLGVAALQKGWLEVVLDRRLNQDDNRGLQQGVLDNKETPNTFRLFVERRSSTSSFPTLAAHRVSLETIHQVWAFPEQLRPITPAPAAPVLVNVTSPQFRSITFLRPDALPCDVHLLNLRTGSTAPKSDADLNLRPGKSVTALFHRLGAECLTCSAFDAELRLSTLFSDHAVDKVQPVTLSGLHNSDNKVLNPSEISAYNLELK